MNEKFDLQEYLTKGVERIVGEAAGQEQNILFPIFTNGAFMD